MLCDKEVTLKPEEPEIIGEKTRSANVAVESVLVTVMSFLCTCPVKSARAFSAQIQQSHKTRQSYADDNNLESETTLQSALECSCGDV